MINNLQLNIKDSIANAINEHLNYVDGHKINLVATHFKIVINDKYDYGDQLDNIYNLCLLDLHNSLAVLNFIYNDYK